MVGVTSSTKKEGTDPKEQLLQVGKLTGKGASRFAKLQNGDAIFVLADAVVVAVDQTALDLLDHRLLTLDPKNIDRFQCSSGADGTFTMEPQGQEWHVVEGPGPSSLTARLSRACSKPGLICKCTAMPIMAQGRPGCVWTRQAYLDRNRFPEEAGGSKGQRAGKTHHDPWQACGEQCRRAYARLDDGPGIVVLALNTVTTLTRTPVDYVDRAMFQVDPAGIKSLKRQMGNEVIQMTKSDDGWQVKPPDQHADNKVAAEVVEQLAVLRANRVASYPVKELEPYGLDVPVAFWKVYVGDAGKEYVLKIGKEVDAQSGDRFALAENSRAVVVLPGTLVRRLLARPVDFRQHELVSVAKPDRVIFRRGPRKVAFAATNDNWALIEPVKAEADSSELAEFIDNMTRLRADELVADKPDNLKPYGLDQPVARWRFQSDDKELLVLTVGGREKIKSAGKEIEGLRRYARLSNNDMVFLLDPNLSARVLQEYRSRNVWPTPPDAAQIESLTYGYADNPFALTKVGNNWKVAGKPDVTIKSQTVNETLAACSITCAALCGR